MKYPYNSFALLIMIALSSCSTSRNYPQNNYTQDYPSQPAPITYRQFYDQLSPYGNWVNYQSYGYVWVPNISGFRPYYNDGHWVYTNYGWTWVSDYNWGWAPFHYGRWMHDLAFGWMWVPGYEWGPAWVSWRGGGEYYGWAPLGPGMGINVSIGSYDSWCFVPRRYINSPRVNNYYVNQTKNVNIINNTTIINNHNNNNTNNKTVYVAGPSASEVEKSTNMKIRQVKLVERNTPGTAEVSKNSVVIYRPPVKAAIEQSVTAKPARVFNTQELEANKQNNNISNPQKPRVFNDNVNENRNQPHAPVTNPVTQPAVNGNNGTNQHVKNEPGTNNIPPLINNNPPDNNPSRTFNKKEDPSMNKRPNSPVIDNSPVNNPSRQPVRTFDNEERHSMNNRQNSPIVNTQPVNKPERNNMQPQRQLQDDAPVYKQRQPIYQQRNMRMETERPAQNIEHAPKQEKQTNEKK